MTLLRWKFHEEVIDGIVSSGVLPDWTFPVNPGSMTAPELVENVTAEPRNVDGQNRDHQGPPEAKQWSFEGTLYTLDEVDTMERWLDRGHVIHLTDHFNRTWRIQLEDVEAVRNGSWNYPERHRYTANALMLGRVTT